MRCPRKSVCLAVLPSVTLAGVGDGVVGGFFLFRFFYYFIKSQTLPVYGGGMARAFDGDKQLLRGIVHSPRRLAGINRSAVFEPLELHPR